MQTLLLGGRSGFFAPGSLLQCLTQGRDVAAAHSDVPVRLLLRPSMSPVSGAAPRAPTRLSLGFLDFIVLSLWGLGMHSPEAGLKQISSNPHVSLVTSRQAIFWYKALAP